MSDFTWSQLLFFVLFCLLIGSLIVSFVLCVILELSAEDNGVIVEKRIDANGKCCLEIDCKSELFVGRFIRRHIHVPASMFDKYNVGDIVELKGESILVEGVS